MNESFTDPFERNLRDINATPIQEAQTAPEVKPLQNLEFKFQSQDNQDVGFKIGPIRDRMVKWTTGEENKDLELDFIQERALALRGEVEGLNADMQAQVLAEKANKLLIGMKKTAESATTAQIQKSLKGQELITDDGQIKLKGAVLELGIVVDALDNAGIPFNLNEQGQIVIGELPKDLKEMRAPLAELQGIEDQAEQQLRKAGKLAEIQQLADQRKPREALNVAAGTATEIGEQTESVPQAQAKPPENQLQDTDVEQQTPSGQEETKEKPSLSEAIDSLNTKQAEYLAWFVDALSKSPNEEQIAKMIKAREQVNVSLDLLKKAAVIKDVFPDQLLEPGPKVSGTTAAVQRAAEGFGQIGGVATEQRIDNMKLRVKMAELGIPLKTGDENEIARFKGLINRLEKALEKKQS